MNGVMIPEVSAGSNQVGASDTCAAQISCPCGSNERYRRRAGGETERGEREEVAAAYAVPARVRFALFLVKRRVHDAPSE
jgi:hypothetical protein